MQSPLDSQQLFWELEVGLRRLHPEQLPDFSGSFSAFQSWLKSDCPEVIQKAEKIAGDVRLWRDTEDVVRQLWERVYHRR